MTTTPLALPGLTPLKEVAGRLGIPERRLRERAAARQFTHVRIGKERYLTDDQLEAFLATYTVGRTAPKKTDRDKALEQTRERLSRQQGRQRRVAA
ncbi:hypothetical protein ACGFI9_37415 [Micromonospora sp. NPDC048930]|uniref:hypothetical protein n=1 Tax=Micromonospora sp. NPDC048930 TaxID=3364261 RepID=UPI00371CA5AD